MATPTVDHSTVETITKRSGSNFYLSFFSLPKPKRDAITAVYAYCREVDDAVDTAPSVDVGRARVAEWRAEIARTFEGHPTLALTRSLAQAIDQFDLTRTYFDGILTGVAMDLDQQRYSTFEALQEYCYHVAGEVGLLCMEIFGYRSERLKQYAVQMGEAFQLTNILRDVGTDGDRGRIYLPQEDLKRFHVTEEEILLKKHTPAFVRLMAFESKRAHERYASCSKIPQSSEWKDLCAAEIMAAIYHELLNQIESRHYQVFLERIRVSTPHKLLLAARTWWRCR